MGRSKKGEKVYILITYILPIISARAVPQQINFYNDFSISFLTQSASSNSSTDVHTSDPSILSQISRISHTLSHDQNEQPSEIAANGVVASQMHAVPLGNAGAGLVLGRVGVVGAWVA